MYALIFISLLGVSVPIDGGKVSYEGYKLYSVTPRNNRQLEQLDVLKNRLAFDFWKEINNVNGTADVLVKPQDNDTFHRLLKSVELKPEIRIDNIQKLIDKNGVSERAGLFNWDAYQRLSDMYDWMDSLAVRNPQIVTVINLKSSAQGRIIKGLRLSFAPGRPAVFIEGGIHAREWISPAVVTYMLNEILYNQSSVVRQTVGVYDWYIFPMFNPDGYEYTFTSDRMWRKNRQNQLLDILGILCKGVDLNRNWNYHWRDNGGASAFPCASDYSGWTPYSAKEASTLNTFLLGLKGQLSHYISYHSYGNYIMPPYGYTRQPPQNYNLLMDIGLKAAEAIRKRYGTVYQVGNSINLLNYVASGTSHDWAAGELGVPITYTFELPDKTNGFLLPARYIIPTGQETFDGLISILQNSPK